MRVSYTPLKDLSTTLALNILDELVYLVMRITKNSFKNTNYTMLSATYKRVLVKPNPIV